MTHNLKYLTVFLLILLAQNAVGQAGNDRSPSTSSVRGNVVAYCIPVIHGVWKQTPGPDETTYRVTVCRDGKMIASHEFTGPALAGSRPDRAKWNYTGKISTEDLGRLKRVLRRSDIASLSGKVNVPDPIPDGAPSKDTMYFSIPREEIRQPRQEVILEGFLHLGCDAERRAMTAAVRDLICLFGDLYQRAKSQEPPSGSCACRSLQNLASGI